MGSGGGSDRTYLIGVVDGQEGGQLGGKESMEDRVGRRRLALHCEVGQRAAEQRYVRDGGTWLTLGLCGHGRDDVPQILAFPPRVGGLFPWVRARQIGICDCLLVPKVAQGLCELREEVALVRLERAPSECRLSEAREQKTLQ